MYFKNSGIVKKSRCVRFTNKFDVIESEVVNDQFHDHIDQEHTVTESVTQNNPATETDSSLQLEFNSLMTPFFTKKEHEQTKVSE